MYNIYIIYNLKYIYIYITIDYYYLLLFVIIIIICIYIYTYNICIYIYIHIRPAANWQPRSSLAVTYSEAAACHEFCDLQWIGFVQKRVVRLQFMAPLGGGTWRYKLEVSSMENHGKERILPEKFTIIHMSGTPFLRCFSEIQGI